MNENEEIEELDLFVWSDEDLEKPKEQSPAFGYLKSIGNNFNKIKGKFKSTDKELLKKVDKQAGKDLSTNDFTDAYKTKLDDLENYDDTEVKQDISDLESENKYLRELNDSLQETVLDSETEASESLVVNTVEGIGRINIWGGERQEKREGYNKATQDKITATNTGYINVTETGVFGKVEANKEYTITFINAGATVSKNIAIRNYHVNSTEFETLDYINVSTTANSRSIKTFTASFDGEISFNSSGFASSETIAKEVMLLEGEYTADTLPQYELFGVSPSLAYPSKIEAVGDNVQLFNEKFRQGSFLSTETSNRIYSTQNNKLEIGTYAVSTDLDMSKYRISVATSEKEFPVLSGSDLFYDSGWQNKKEIIFTIEKKGYLGIGVSKIDNTDFTVDNIKDFHFKVEKGSKATSYSKFGQGSVEIKASNKNIFKETYNEKTATTQYRSIINGDFELKEGLIYTVSFDTNNNSGRVYINEEIFNTSERKNCDGERHAIIATAKKSGVFKNETVIKTAATVTTAYDISNVQIELANTNSDYVEHDGETLVMPIQQRMFSGDTFERKDGVWYEKHNWLELVLDEENINKLVQESTNTTDLYRYRLTLQDLVKITDKAHAKGYCTHFLTANYSATYTKERGFTVSQSNDKSNLYIYNEGETLEEFKAKIVNENVTFYLQLVEPTLIKCTSEQSKILDKINTYRDCTIITTDNDLCKISLRYKKDTDKEIDNLKQAVIALGGIV